MQNLSLEFWSFGFWTHPTRVIKVVQEKILKMKKIPKSIFIHACSVSIQELHIVYKYYHHIILFHYTNNIKGYKKLIAVLMWRIHEIQIWIFQMHPSSGFILATYSEVWTLNSKYKYYSRQKHYPIIMIRTIFFCFCWTKMIRTN